MNTHLDQLHSAVLSLPEAERARLAAGILASLDEDGTTDAAWVSEVRERLAAYRRGEVGARESGMHTRLHDFERLTIAERIQLVEDLWDSISEAEEVLDLTDTQRAELDRRLATHASRPGAAIPWAVLRAEPLARDGRWNARGHCPRPEQSPRYGAEAIQGGCGSQKRGLAPGSPVEQCIRGN
ncbi:MAG TPA: addiction module protein [Longimicrobiales bacterium]|nr:addiction module protein [Longimicrobiales bacterium]